MSNYIVQAIGFIGLFFVVLSFQKNENKKILFLQVFATIFYFLHFLLLGAITGSIMNAIATARNYVFYNREKKWANKSIWLYFFILVYLLGAFVTWDSYISLLPMIAMINGTIALWIKNPKHTRLIMLTTSPCWFIYNYMFGSIPGMITDVFSLTSIIVGIIRFDILKSKSISDN